MRNNGEDDQPNIDKIITSDADQKATSKRPCNGIQNRIVLVAAVLTGEYFLFSEVFDISPLLATDSWFSIIGYLGTLAPLAIITVTTLALVGGSFLGKQLVESASQLPLSRNAPLWITHIGSFVVLFALTPRIYTSTLFLGIWIALASVSGLSALFLAFSPTLLVFFVKRTWRILAIGTALGITAWGAALLSEGLWNPLGAITLNSVAFLVQQLPGDALFIPEEAIVGTGDFSVRIAPVCSGYQGIGLMTVFMGVYLIWQRNQLKFPISIIIVPAGLILVWLFNVVRITILIGIGAKGYSNIALGGFHAKAGWLLFCGLAMGIVVLTQRSTLFRKIIPNRTTEDSWNPTAAYLLPFLTAVSFSMLTSLFSADGFDLWYGIHILAAGGVYWFYRNTIRPSRLRIDIFSIAMGVLIGAAWVGMDLLWPPETANVTPTWLSELSKSLLVAWISMRVIGSCIVIPIIEEVAFRGYLLRRLISADFTEVSYRKFTWISFAVSSVVFGFMHGRWLAGILAGMTFALIVKRRGNLTDGILAHAAANAVIAAVVLFGDKWSLWV